MNDLKHTAQALQTLDGNHPRNYSYLPLQQKQTDLQVCDALCSVVCRSHLVDFTAFCRSNCAVANTAANQQQMAQVTADLSGCQRQ
jgi:hypothetical protein